MEEFRRDITEAIRKLAHPVSNQAEIDRQSAELLQMDLHECPECGRKFVSTSSRCAHCQGE
jgi:uncharacterized OB-fold protein